MRFDDSYESWSDAELTRAVMRFGAMVERLEGKVALGERKLAKIRAEQLRRTRRTTPDLWANAKANARLDCGKCHGAGCYSYDANHSKICDACCTHSMGWFRLGEHYAHAGHWCCRAGCGTTRADTPDTESAVDG